MKKCIFSILLLMVHAVSLGETIVLHSANDLLNVSNQITYLEDKTANLEIGDVVSANDHSAFIASDQEIFHHLPTKSNFWFKINFQNMSNEDAWLELATSYPREVDFYRMDSIGNISEVILVGTDRPVENKAHQANTYWFPLSKAGDQQIMTYYVKINIQGPFEAPFHIGSLLSLTINKGHNDAITFGFISLMVIMLLYNSFLFAVIRDKIYLTYSIYLLFTLIAVPFLHNYPFIEKVIDRQWWHHHFITWSAQCQMIVGVFAIHYLTLKNKLPLFYSLIIGIIVVIEVLGLLNLFMPVVELLNIYQLFTILLYLSCLIAAYILSIRKMKGAKYYALGWTFMLGSLFVFLGTVNGIFPYSIYTRNVLYLGFSIEVLLFSLALGNRINVLRKSQEKLNEALSKTNQELMVSNEALDSFNYHVSHDLKTVVSNAESIGILIQKYNEKKDRKKVEELVQNLNEIVKNGADTIKGFLAIGKMTSLIHKSENLEINIQSVVNDILKKQRFENKITVSFVREDFESLKINEKMLSSILKNLLTNSIKYCNGPAEANFELISDSNWNVIKYSDNGIGIDLDRDGDKLFHPFQKLNVKSDVEGTGIGLYLIRRIILSYKGDIFVQSELNKGTTFTIRFPKEMGD